MTLPASGNPISTSQVNVEIRKSSTALITFDDAEVRRLFEVPSGQISMDNGHGKTFVFISTILTTSSDVNLRAYALQQGWDQVAPVTITIDENAVIGASSTGTYALTIDGVWPNGVTLVNKGKIVGKGGAGGFGGGYYIPGNYGDWAGFGGTGGPALSVSTSVTINNTGIIGGGGGGGGGGGIYYVSSGRYRFPAGSGGGGGGGAGFGSGGVGGYQSGGYGGAGVPNGYAGASGTATSGGAGGADGSGGYGGGGGSGGSLGAGGGGGATTNYYNSQGRAGGGSGAAVSGNSYITWASTGTILGSRA